MVTRSVVALVVDAVVDVSPFSVGAVALTVLTPLTRPVMVAPLVPLRDGPVSDDELSPQAGTRIATRIAGSSLMCR